MRAPGHLAVLTLVALAAGASGSSTERGGGGGGPPRALVHDAYVWQRAWTGAVRASVAAAPAELATLRVLVRELGRGGADAWPGVDTASLVRADRPVIAVVRIDGSRLPAGLSIAPVVARVEAWRAAGVRVEGIEIDHDCATAALPAYADWLARSRPAGLRWSITALPAWADDPRALRRVVAAVDETVVQVHAVRAPEIFVPAEARAGFARFARAAPGATLSIALPTYAVVIGGVVRAARPAEVAAFVRWLARGDAPPVHRVVWFRLPVAGDTRAWPAETLREVLHAR